MKVFKISTSWTGYSEITIKAKDEDEAREKFLTSDYDYDDEKFTGNGLDYGFVDEQIIDLEEIEKEEMK